tara:strand:- start:767 stop:1567 length:801 start_codon:yes stop_codon:yes gene_type:complete
MRRAMNILIVLGGVTIGGCKHEAESVPPVSVKEPVEFDSAHQQLAKILEQVTDGFGPVDYEILHRDPKALEEYLNHAASVPRSQFDGWPKPERMAFLLNVYNAATLKLMADHYPVTSIKMIGGVRSVWNLKVVRLFGEKWTLNDVEHGMIRKMFQSPFIHFALVCGAKGCPVLRKEPYTAARLEEQFAEQARSFLRDEEKNFVELGKQELHLSPIFKWYGEDFGKDDAEIIQFVADYFPAKTAEALRAGGFKIRYTDYDWSANTKK